MENKQQKKRKESKRLDTVKGTFKFSALNPKIVLPKDYPLVEFILISLFQMFQWLMFFGNN